MMLSICLTQGIMNWFDSLSKGTPQRSTWPSSTIMVLMIRSQPINVLGIESTHQHILRLSSFTIRLNLGLHWTIERDSFSHQKTSTMCSKCTVKKISMKNSSRQRKTISLMTNTLSCSQCVLRVTHSRSPSWSTLCSLSQQKIWIKDLWTSWWTLSRIQ